jgi:hypothetical protein
MSPQEFVVEYFPTQLFGDEPTDDQTKLTSAFIMADIHARFYGERMCLHDQADAFETILEILAERMI